MMEEKEKKEKKEMTEIVIKLITYDNMYYTYAKINKNVDEVIDCLKFGDDLNEALELVCTTTLDKLKRKLEEDKFVFSIIENKILNVNEIKEVSVFRF